MASFNRGNNNGRGDDDGDRKLPTRAPTLEISEPRCATCKSQYRRTIDQLLVMGISFSEVARQFESEGLTRKGIANHRKRHLSVEQAAVRQIIEERAFQMGEDIENAKRIHLTRKGVLEVAMLKGYGGIIGGDTVVEARDLIGIVQQLEKMDEFSASVQLDELQRQMNFLLDAVRKVVPGHLWDAVLAEFDRLIEGSKQKNSYAVEVPPLELEFPGITDGYETTDDD